MNRRWLIACILLIILVATLLIFGNRLFPQRWANFHLERAKAALSTGQFDQARSQLRSILRQQPDHLEARRQLAQLELRSNQAEQAFLQLQAMTEMHPEDAAGWLGYAKLMSAGKALDEAERAAGRAIEAYPVWADAYQLRAELRYKLGWFHGADLDARKTLELAPERAPSWNLHELIGARLQAPPPAVIHAVPSEPSAKSPLDRGGIWPGQLAVVLQAVMGKMHEKKWPAAQSAADEARAAFPDTMFGPWLAGLVEFSQGHLDAAEANFLQALAIAPRSHRVLTGLARLWSAQHGAAYAGERLAALTQKDPGFALPWQISAYAYLEARQPAKAEAMLRQGFTLQPPLVIPYRELAALYLELDRSGEALSICEQGLERFPQDRELRRMRAQLSIALNDADGAISLYEELLTQRPDDDLIAGDLAKLLIARHDPVARGRALSLVHAIEYDAPSDATLLDQMGWVYLQGGEAQRALALLVAATQAAPEEPALHFHLASVYAQSAQNELARKELNIALQLQKIFPERSDAQRLLQRLGK